MPYPLPLTTRVGVVLFGVSAFFFFFFFFFFAKPASPPSSLNIPPHFPTVEASISILQTALTRSVSHSVLSVGGSGHNWRSRERRIQAQGENRDAGSSSQEGSVRLHLQRKVGGGGRSLRLEVKRGHGGLGLGFAWGGRRLRGGGRACCCRPGRPAGALRR
jgi:hypothetical protein